MGGFLPKVIIVGLASVSYLGWRTLSWSTPNQKRRIKRSLKSPLKFVFPDIHLSRPAEELRLSEYISGHPTGRPMVVTGPDGSGKTLLLKTVLHGRPNTIFIDLRQSPITSDDEFMYQFVRHTGFMLPSSELLARWLLREKTSKKRITKADVDKALTAFEGVLIDEKSSQWKNGVPLICVNGINAISGGRDKDDEGANLSKFLDFCVFACENHLAHVVLITTYHFTKTELDSHFGFRHRREIVDINYPSDQQVTKFLDEDVNTYFKEIRDLTDEEVKFITEKVGGSLTDLSAVITEIGRGISPYDTIERMIADNVHDLITRLEKFLEAAIVYEKDEEHYLNRFLRFWKMMQQLTENLQVSRTDLLASTFAERYSELDSYEAENIVCFRQYTSPLSMIHPSQLLDPEKYNQTTESTTSLSVEAPKDRDLENVIVSAGSSRMRAAFNRILGDSRMVAIKEQVECKLKKKKLKKQLKETAEDLQLLAIVRRDLVREHEVVVMAYQRYLESFGKEKADQMLARTLDAQHIATEKAHKLLHEKEELEQALDKL